MDNKQILEEIDIIVRAKVDECREDLKKVIKETNKMVNSVSKDFQQMNKDGQFDGVRDGIQQCKKECQNLQKEVRKVKIDMNGVSFSFAPEKTGDFQKQYDEAFSKYEEKMKKFQGDTSITSEMSSPTITTPTNSPISTEEIKKANQEVYSLQQRLKDFDALTIREELRTVGIQIKSLISQIREAKVETKSVIPIFSNMGTIAKNSFIQAGIKIKEISNSFSKPISKVKEFINKIRGIGKETDKAKRQSKGLGDGIGQSFSKGIKSIKKFALSLLSVRTAFSAISRASQAYLSFDTQLSESIQNCWNVLGSLLAPILEYVIGLFSKLVSIVATFVKALTGIDLVARANAKALDKQAKSTKGAASASKQLSSIDDIESLSTGSGGGGGEDTPTLTVEDIDITPLEKFYKKAKEIFSKIFVPFKEAWDSVGADVLDSFFSMLENLGDLGKSVFSSILEVWTNGTGTELITNSLLGFQQIFDIVSGISSSLNEAWNNANNGTKIIQSIANIFKSIQQFSLSIGDSLLKWVISDGFQEALNKIFGFIKDIFKYVEDMCNWLLEMYDKYVKPVVDGQLLPAIDSIITAIMDIWNAVKPIIDFIVQYIGAVLEPVIQGLCETIGGIIQVIKGIAEFISGVFTLDWKKAWNGIKDIFGGVWNSIASFVKTPVNTIISAVEFLVNKMIEAFNSVKRSINKLSFDVPDWVPVIGGKKWGFNISMSSPINIPRLATGDVAYEETQVIVGEYPSANTNPEIISPVSMMKDSFRDVLNEQDGGGTRVDRLCINVAGENFYDDTIDYINEKSTRKGVSVIKEVES